MKFDGLKKYLVGICAVATLGLAGCATDEGNRRSPGQFASDAALTAKVKTAIANDVGAGTAANINVNSYRGEVQLTGFVSNADEARRAATAANRVEGVNRVVNDVRVK